MTADGTADLFARRREPDARRALVEEYDWLAKRLARRFRGRGVELDDLIQVARYGLLNAIDRYDPDRGVKFTTYAGRTIVGEIQHHFRDQAWSLRVPRSLQNLWLEVSRTVEDLSQSLGRSPTIGEIADAIGVDEDRVLEALEAGDAFTASSIDQPFGADDDRTPTDVVGGPDPAMEHVLERSDLTEHLAALPERQRTILYLRVFEGRTQSEIADVVGVSQVHVSRLLSRALDSLKAAATTPDAE